MTRTAVAPVTSSDRLLRKWQIIPALIPVSSSTFDRWVRAGRFPSGTLVSPRVRVWPLEEIQEWMRRSVGREGLRP